METRTSSKRIEPLRAPKKNLGDLPADTAAKVLTASADIALILDSKGVIRDISLSTQDLVRDGCLKWLGQHWIETVTTESRSKVELLLSEAGSNASLIGREINHSLGRRLDLPIRYTTIKIGKNGKVLAVGRDLRAISSMQQKLIDTQQTMEQEYSRLRNAETRYRLLFQISSEAVLIIDAANNRILEINPAALKLFGKSSKRLAGHPLQEFFTSETQRRLQGYFTALKSSGQAEEIVAKLDHSKADVAISASLFRQENTAHLLVRLTPTSEHATTLLHERASLLDVIEKIPDGFVVTDQERRILIANNAFVEMTQLATEEQVRGEVIDRWVGRHPIDMSLLGKNLKERGEVRTFSTVVRGEYGTSEDVEISAVSVTSGVQPCFGMTVRRTSRRTDTTLNARRALPRSVEQLTELVGRVPLKDLVRESTDMIERLCIEAALELTDDNRASAAEMLGLSRQGLYSKLRRHGMGDLDTE